MSTLAAAGFYREGAPRLVATLAVVLAGLWLVQIYPQADALFNPLNILTAEVSASLLAAIGLPVTQELTRLTHASGFSCEIDSACTAFAPVVLLTAAILGWRAPRRWQLVGVLMGAVVLSLINQLRLVSLVWLGVQAPAWLDLAHLWLWPAALLFVIAGYWYVWARAQRS